MERRKKVTPKELGQVGLTGLVIAGYTVGLAACEEGQQQTQEEEWLQFDPDKIEFEDVKIANGEAIVPVENGVVQVIVASPVTESEPQVGAFFVIFPPYGQVPDGSSFGFRVETGGEAEEIEWERVRVPLNQKAWPESAEEEMEKLVPVLLEIEEEVLSDCEEHFGEGVRQCAMSQEPLILVPPEPPAMPNQEAHHGVGPSGWTVWAGFSAPQDIDRGIETKQTSGVNSLHPGSAHRRDVVRSRQRQIVDNGFRRPNQNNTGPHRSL